MTSAKRARDNEDSDEDMASDVTSPALSSSAPTESSEQRVKRLHLDDFSNSSLSEDQIIRCVLPPHSEMVFTTYDAYEIHYEQHHLHRCIECHKNFPSDHYMHLHIAENHDPITAVKRDRGERTVCRLFLQSLRSLLIQMLIWLVIVCLLRGRLRPRMFNRTEASDAFDRQTWLSKGTISLSRLYTRIPFYLKL
jgi:hypothetical protein